MPLLPLLSVEDPDDKVEAGAWLSLTERGGGRMRLPGADAEAEVPVLLDLQFMACLGGLVAENFTSTISHLRTTLAGTAKATVPSEPSLLHCSQRELSWHWVRVWGRIFPPPRKRVRRKGNEAEYYQSINVELKIDAGEGEGAECGLGGKSSLPPEAQECPEITTVAALVHP